MQVKSSGAGRCPGHETADVALVIEAHLAGLDEPGAQALPCPLHSGLGRRQREAGTGSIGLLGEALNVAKRYRLPVFSREFQEHPWQAFGQTIDWCSLVIRGVRQFCRFIQRHLFLCKAIPVDQQIPGYMKQPGPPVHYATQAIGELHGPQKHLMDEVTSLFSIWNTGLDEA